MRINHIGEIERERVTLYVERKFTVTFEKPVTLYEATQELVMIYRELTSLDTKIEGPLKNDDTYSYTVISLPSAEYKILSKTLDPSFEFSIENAWRNTSLLFNGFYNYLKKRSKISGHD